MVLLLNTITKKTLVSPQGWFWHISWAEFFCYLAQKAGLWQSRWNGKATSSLSQFTKAIQWLDNYSLPAVQLGIHSCAIVSLWLLQLMKESSIILSDTFTNLAQFQVWENCADLFPFQSVKLLFSFWHFQGREFSGWLRHTPILIFDQFLLYPLYFEQVLKTKYML